jgi:hypothetical protein
MTMLSKMLGLKRFAAVVAFACSFSAAAVHADESATAEGVPYAGAGAFLVEPTSLVVERVTLVVDCSMADERPRCRFEAVYDVSNPTDLVEEVPGLFVGLHDDEIAIAIDGVDVRRHVPSEHVVSAGFVVRVEPREKKSLRLSGRLDSTETHRNTRPVVLSSTPQAGRAWARGRS